MHDDTYERIHKNPKFTQLVKKRSRFAWTLSITILLIYYTFILLIAFSPETLGTPLFEGGVTTIGIPVGIAIIVAAFVLTGLYVRRANKEFDKLNSEIVREVEQ
jgi:uncharacterized membrane protein (DUF485 family)